LDENSEQIHADRTCYQVLFDQNWYLISPKYFINDFRKLFSNFKEVNNAKEMKTLLNEIADGKYNFEGTPKVIERLSKITETQN